MTALFSKPKVPDTSAQQALIAEQDKRVQAAENETQRASAAGLAARRRRARTSLITGSEAGVMRQQLG